MMDGALRATLAALEERRPDLRGAVDVAELHRVRAQVAAEQHGSFEDLRRESFRRVLADHGVVEEGLPEWMVATWMDARVTSVVLHPDVEPALVAAGRGRSRAGGDHQRQFPVDRLPLAETFAFIVHAERVGDPKPAADAFLHAVELSGGDPARWVHVGDDSTPTFAVRRRWGCGRCGSTETARNCPPTSNPTPSWPHLTVWWAWWSGCSTRFTEAERDLVTIR